MSIRTRGEGPSLHATPFEGMSDGVATRLLTPRQRQDLISLSTLVTVPARGMIYHAHAQAAAVFICREGAVKTFRELPSGRRRVTAFLFAKDILGLAEHGRYVNSAQALTKTVLYRLPIGPLTAVLRSDADLEFKFLLKLTHELRKAQFQAIMLGRKSARGRIAMFLTMLERHLHAQLRKTPGTIPLPMSRSDMAAYLGLTLESVSRASTQLVRDGLIAFRGPHEVRVTNPKALARLAADV